MKYLRFFWIFMAISVILASGTIAHYMGWISGMILMLFLGFALGLHTTITDSDSFAKVIGSGGVGFVIILAANIITSCVFSFWLILFGAISATLLLCGMLLGARLDHTKNLYASLQIAALIPLSTIILKEYPISLIVMLIGLAIAQGFVVAKDYIPIKKTLLSQQEVAAILVSVGMVFVASYSLELRYETAGFIMGVFASCALLGFGVVAHFVAVFVQDFSGIPMNR